VAAALGDGVKVALVEQEQQPGYHSTGRSAAIYSPTYGPTPIRALTRASLAYFLTSVSDEPQSFLTPIDAAFIARADQSGSFDALCSELNGVMNWREMEANEIQNRVSFLREGYVSKAILDSDTSEIDVALLHQSFLKAFSHNGGMLLNSTEVLELKKQKNGWLVKTNQGGFVTKIIVNAAGAWGEQIGSLAGAECIGLTPKRRTALIVEPPSGADLSRIPLVIDIDERAAKETEKRILNAGGTAFAIQGDVTDLESMENAFKRCIDRFGQIDVLHNNVGILKAGGVSETTVQDWDQLVHTNMKAVFLPTKAVLPHFIKRRSDCVINVSSIAGLRYLGAPYIAYNATKGSIISFTRN
jgi:glycine/D-amino acid oxidase-like deaminating enzyme